MSGCAASGIARLSLRGLSGASGSFTELFNAASGQHH
jgi:hypothetical protein